jgi:hypothetical protein
MKAKKTKTKNSASRTEALGKKRKKYMFAFSDTVGTIFSMPVIKPTTGKG